MKKRLLNAFAVVAVGVACWAVWAQACDKDKHASAQALNARGATVTAVVAGAGYSGCTHGVSATTASSHGGRECCAGKEKGATAAALGHEACTSKFLGAGMIGAPICTNRGTPASTADMHGECDACADMVSCSNELSANGVQTQIVPLKNGVMFVYSSDTPAHVRAVQNALARRSDRLNALAQSGDRARLCPECKNMRGAIASGKLSRETVNVEGGCLTLVTSTDPSLVARLRAMASASQSSGRNKI